MRGNRILLGLMVVGLAGCESVGTPTAPPPDPDLSRFGRPDIVVLPGTSIQDAIDRAAPGDRIFVRPGIYRETVTISKPGIALVGLGQRNGIHGVPVIENPGGADDGIKVTSAATGVEIVNLVVRGFEENGVYLRGVSGFVLRDIVAVDNGEYGLFPVFSSGVVERCVASGHSDTGIYIGQSNQVVIRNNTAFGNVNGIEVENSTDIQVLDNDTHNNTAGIIVVLLPGFPTKVSSNILVEGNRVRDNNLPNFSTGGFEQFVPAGSGILVVGADQTTVRNNTVHGNSFVGIAVANTGLLAQLAGVPIDVEPFPDGARVENNTVTRNGGAQPIPFLPPGTDLLWDGTGVGACWTGNTFFTSLNLDLLGGNPTPSLPACS